MQSLVIVGRKWFDKVNGNTYHTAQIIVDGKIVHTTERTYGYGNQYVDTAAQWLESQGLVKLQEYANGNKEVLWRWAEREGIALTCTATDVSRKRDL